MADSAKRRATGRQKLELLFFACTVLVVVLIVAEIASRFLCPHWRPFQSPRNLFWNYDAQLGWSLRPNQRGPFVGEDFSVSVSNNNWGLRDDEYPLERTGKSRMLVLGDSFAWGFGVELDRRFSEILEAKHADWEIINSAVSGYSTDQEYIYLKNRGIAFRPDVVLLVMYENDFPGNIASEHMGYYKPYFTLNDDRLEPKNYPVPRRSWRQSIHLWILGKTYLFRRIYLGGNTLVTRIVPKWSQNSGSGLLRRQADITSRLIETIHQLCRENGSKFVIATYGLDENQSDCVMAVCASESIPCLSLDRALAAGLQSVTFPHDAHWNPIGHLGVADALDDFLTRQGIWSLGSPVSSIP